MNLLSVDDSATVRKVIKAACEALEFNFYEAKNGKEALDFLHGGTTVHLILLDWNMPLMSGYDLLTTIKEDSKLKSIPVMMVTTESEKTHVISAIRAGAANYMTKPFTVEELMTKIMECIGEKL